MKTLSVTTLLLSFVSLMVFWYIMSGFFDPVHSLMGVASVAAVMAINHRYKKERFFEDETDVLADLRFQRVPFYLVWLMWQILVSAVQVAGILLSRNLKAEPQMIRFRVNLPNAHAKMILGNSITLTPGTLTVAIEGDIFMVHALVPSALAGIIDDSMPHQVLKLFEKETYTVVTDVELIQKEEEIADG